MLGDDAAQARVLLAQSPGAAFAANGDGETALHRAATAGAAAVARVLLEHEGSAPGLARSTDTSGRTPLIHAAMHGHASVCEVLVQHGGCGINAADSTGLTAVLYARDAGNTDVCDLLARAGATDTIWHQHAQDTQEDTQVHPVPHDVFLSTLHDMSSADAAVRDQAQV